MYAELGFHGELAALLIPDEGATVDERLDNYRKALDALRQELVRVQQRLDEALAAQRDY